MKRLFTLLAFVVTIAAMSQSVAISDDGSVADGSAILELKSTTKGFLPPRMTSAQRGDILDPVAGLQIWCSDCGLTGAMYFYTGSEWSNGGTGITSAQKDAIAANTDKEGITSDQKDAIVDNTAKEGITSDQKVAITANTDKEGITSGQAANIITNNGKTSDINHVLISSTADLVEDTNLYYTETRVSANTDVSTNKTNIASETARLNDQAALIASLQAQIAELISATKGLLLPSVTIGTQQWMKKNLDVATYRDGTPIPEVPRFKEDGSDNGAAWRDLKTGAWCYYTNADGSNEGATYGKLYNWYAVAGIYDAASLTDATLRKELAPTGWHVPSDGDWITIRDALGGFKVVGSKMKETGTAHWNNPNAGANNSSGFTGLPGGYRNEDGAFTNIGNYGNWWSSPEYTTSNAWYCYLSYNVGGVHRSNTSKTFGFSVRCLRD